MSESNLRLNVVRDNYNEANFEYEVRRLPQESPVEYAMTRRWLDQWVADGAMVADVGVGVGHYALHLARRGCKIHLVDLGYAHLTTVAEFRALFQEHFDEKLLAGVESFTGHAQKQWHQLDEANREAWLELVHRHH